MAFVAILITNKVTPWATSYSACVVYAKKLFTSVPVKVVDIYRHLFEEIRYYTCICVVVLFFGGREGGMEGSKQINSTM